MKRLKLFICIALLSAVPLFSQQGYIPVAVDFDGSADDLERVALVGAADSKTGIISAWFRADGGNGTSLGIFGNNGSSVYLRRSGGNKMKFVLHEVGQSVILDTTTVNNYMAGEGWQHYLASWDLEGGDTDNIHLYVNDVDDQDGTTTVVDDTIDYTRTIWNYGSGAAGFLFDGGLAEFYFAPGEFLDFSIEVNRRLFITADLKPVDLGPSGYKPTGTAPIVYMRTPFNNAGLNSGTGGDFVINGAPTSTPGPVAVVNPSYTNLPSAGQNASEYDGVGDYLLRSSALIGDADSQVGTMSFWFRMDGQDAENNVFINSATGGWLVSRLVDGRLKFESLAGPVIYRGFSNSTYTAGPDWHHALFSMDSAGSPISHLYIDGVDELDEDVHVPSSTHDWTEAGWAIASMETGDEWLEGDLAEFYLHTGEYIDFSVLANRRLFVNADGQPVDLGPACATPTSSAPILCLTFDYQDTFGLNSGTGGDFTVNGSPSWEMGPLPVYQMTGRVGAEHHRRGRHHR